MDDSSVGAIGPSASQSSLASASPAAVLDAVLAPLESLAVLEPAVPALAVSEGAVGEAEGEEASIGA